MFSEPDARRSIGLQSQRSMQQIKRRARLLWRIKTSRGASCGRGGELVDGC